MQRTMPCLWFDNKAEEAAKFYTGIFKNSSVTNIAHSNGAVFTVGFNLDGQQYLALNGGPLFTFTEAISIVVNCDTQDEIDYYWEKLSSGGKETGCGWLQDKYGLSWQIVPVSLSKLMTSNPEKSQRVMQTLMKMKKLDIAALENA